MLDAHRLETAQPRLELLSVCASEGDVVEPNAHLVEPGALIVMLILVDGEHRLEPDGRPVRRFVKNCGRRIPKEAFVPCHASVQIGDRQSKVVEGWER